MNLDRTISAKVSKLSCMLGIPENTGPSVEFPIITVPPIEYILLLYEAATCSKEMC